MSAQLGEFTIKTQAFKCQGRCGTRSRKVPRYPTSPNIHKPKCLLGLQGKHLRSADMQSYLLTQMIATSSGFSRRKVTENEAAAFPVFSKQDRKCRRAPRAHFHNQTGGWGRQGDSGWIHTSLMPVRATNCWKCDPMGSLQENLKNKVGQR